MVGVGLGVWVAVGEGVKVSVGCSVNVGIAVAVGAQADKKKAMRKNRFSFFMMPIFLFNFKHPILHIFQRGVWPGLAVGVSPQMARK